MSEILSKTRQRSFEIQKTDGLFNEFYFEDQTIAFNKVKENLQQANKPVLLDIDDTIVQTEPILRLFLNSYIKELLPEFESVSLTEVINFGGRYFQTPKYQEAAKKIGVPFGEIFKKIATNQYLHSCVKPSKNQTDFINFLSENNFNIIGYPTARPKELIEITARSFNYFNFPVAPIIDTQASSADPSEAKVAFFKKLLAGSIVNRPILFFDDHVKTAIKLKEEFSGIINPIVPIVPRNKHEIEKLKENNINFGTLQELSKVIDKNYQS